MVTQDMVRIYEAKYITFVTALDLIECRKQIR